MALRTFSLSELTRRAGLSKINAAEITKDFDENNTKSSAYRQNIDQTVDSETAYRSMLGTPVYSNLIIPSGQYKDLDGRTVAFAGLRLDTILFEVIPTKNIVRTPMNGSTNGTVKQYISLGDYEVRGSGIITGSSFESGGAGKFNVERSEDVPEEEIRKINEIFKVPQEVEIVSEFLDFFDISTVVIDRLRISQIEGYRDSLLIDIEMISDNPVELR